MIIKSRLNKARNKRNGKDPMKYFFMYAAGGIIVILLVVVAVKLAREVLSQAHPRREW